MLATMKKIISIVIFVFILASVLADLPTVKTPEQLLEIEIIKMLEAPDHLRTAYIYGPDHRYDHNDYDRDDIEDAQLFDEIFHNPADTIYTLAIAYPYTSSNTKARLRTYMQEEYNTYQPYRYDHRGVGGIGTSLGAHREYNDVPIEVRSNYGGEYEIFSTPRTLTKFDHWSFNPFNYYALYKYAEIMGNAQSILSSLSSAGHARPAALPSDSVLSKSPHILNSYLAGYIGYQGLRELAGQSRDSTIQSYLNSGLQKRVNMLPSTTKGYYNMGVHESGGFLWLVPEVGDYLYNNARSQVNYGVSTYEQMIPYWMIPNVDEGTRLRNDFYNEGTLSHPYDSSSLFLAKAYALKLSRQELENYLHNSGYMRGDLFYIQNLVATIDAGTYIPPGNIAPFASSSSIEMQKDTQASITLVYTDSDGPGPNTIAITNQPDHGTLTGTGINRIYTPNVNYYGSDYFTWRVYDSIDYSNTATFQIHINQPNLPADINDDDIVNVLDLIIVAGDFGKTAGYNPDADLNGDRVINIQDLITVARDFGAVG